MDLLQLRYFETVAQLENISRAAVIHQIPQPAMSKTISRLEKELGTPLFDRNNNRLRLNESGAIFLQYIRESLRSLDDAVQAVQDRKAMCREIRILVLTNRRLVTECIAQFKQRHPEALFRIGYSAGEKQPFEFDLCISSEPPQQDELDHIVLLKEKMHLAVAVTDPLALRTKVDFSELEDRRFVLLPETSSLHRQAMMQGAICGFTPQIGILCDDPTYVRKYVSMGLGITMSPEISWKGLFSEKVALLPLYNEEKPVMRTTRLFWHKNRYISEGVRELMDLIRAEFADASL